MDAHTSLNQILLAPWRQRSDTPWVRGLIAVLLLVLGVVGLVALPGPGKFLLLTVGLLLVLAGLWVTVLGSLLEQNHPHAARFVPGHVAQLRRAALGTWALASLASAGLLVLTLPMPTSFPLLLLAAAATCLYLAWAQRNWVLWLLLWVGPSLYGALGLHARLRPLYAQVAAVWSEQTLTLTAAALLALAALLARLFGDGSERHQAAYALRSRILRMTRDGLSGKRTGLAGLGRPGQWLARPFDRAASAWLARLIAHSSATEASAMSRAEIVLYGQQHWLRQAMGVLLVLVLIVCSFAIAFALAGRGLRGGWQQGAVGMAIGLVSLGFNPSFALPNMLWHSRREQALLRLLPGMPQGAQLNRAVAWRQLRQTGVAWGLTTLALGLLAEASGHSALLNLAFGALPLAVACTLRSPAAMRPPTSWTTVLPVFGFFALGGALYGLQRGLGVPLAVVVGVSLALTAALGVWRWRAVCAAPVALPAGRLA